MSTGTIIMNEEDQRALQAEFWGLPKDASWTDIRAAARMKGVAMVLFHPDDWEETITRLYGPVFDQEP